jgi:hypothetical protein
VRVFDVGTWGDAPYITMELIDGPHPRASRGPSPTEWCVASLLKRPHPRASRGPSPTEGALRRSSNALTPALRAAPRPRRVRCVAPETPSPPRFARPLSHRVGEGQEGVV